jgi:hypothetical protein
MRLWSLRRMERGVIFKYAAAVKGQAIRLGGQVLVQYAPGIGSSRRVEETKVVDNWLQAWHYVHQRSAADHAEAERMKYGKA